MSTQASDFSVLSMQERHKQWGFVVCCCLFPLRDCYSLLLLICGSNGPLQVLFREELLEHEATTHSMTRRD